MARDRQRAKQRKQRRPPSGGGVPPRRDDDAPVRDDLGPTPHVPSRDEDDALGPEPDALHRANVQGAWQHGGEVDEFEAALVAGADGEPDEDPNAAARASTGANSDVVDVDGADANAAAVSATGRVAGPAESVPGRGGGRFWNFLKASWAELQRVRWPDRRQVGQATMVVLGFVIAAGAFLGLADFVSEQLVDLII